MPKWLKCALKVVAGVLLSPWRNAQNIKRLEERQTETERKVFEMKDWMRETHQWLDEHHDDFHDCECP